MKAISNSPTPRENALRSLNGLISMPVNVGCVRFRGGGIVLTAAIKTQSFIAIIATFICLTISDARSQVPAHVKISLSNTHEVAVQVVSSTPLRSWSFINAYAGVLGIAERVEGLRTREGEVRKIAVGEFR